MRTGRYVYLWLAALSASMALALTVCVLDRTSLAGLSRQWLAFFAVTSLAILGWWVSPTVAFGKRPGARYRLSSVAWGTAPLAAMSWGLVAAAYGSAEVHHFLQSYFSAAAGFSNRSWPAGLVAALFLAYSLAWFAREIVLAASTGLGARDAAGASLPKLSSLLPLGVLSTGLLLAMASVATINVNFWRYWATADGWAVLGRYPSTFTDALHVEQGGVSMYFISFPLLPSLLSGAYSLVGHNTLGSHLPLILGSALLPLAVFLTARLVTGNSLIALLFALAISTFPLLRNYTLDMPEADGLLMSCVVLGAYFRLRADRLSATPKSQVAAGVVAGVASLARPEGVLYMGAMYLASLRERWRESGFWLSVLVFVLVIAVFSAVTLREFGMLWPGNHSATLRLSNISATLEVVRDTGLFSMYASAMQLPVEILAILTALVLVALVACTVWMLRERFSLAYMPAVALANVAMVFLVGPIPAEAGKFHDFFRHISYGFPLLAVTLAYGTGEIWKRIGGGLGAVARVIIVLTLAGIILAQISLQASAVTPGNLSRGPIMTTDVHVMATEVMAKPHPLPVMRFRQSDDRFVPNAPEYMSVFPDDVNAYYAAADVRDSDNAVDYYRAVAVLVVALLAIALAGRMASSSGSRLSTSSHTGETSTGETSRGIER